MRWIAVRVTCWFVRGQLVGIPGFRRHRSVGDLECRLAAGARGGWGLFATVIVGAAFLRIAWRPRTCAAGRCATGGSDRLACGIGDRREGGRAVRARHPPRSANRDHDHARCILAASARLPGASVRSIAIVAPRRRGRRRPLARLRAAHVGAEPGSTLGQRRYVRHRPLLRAGRALALPRPAASLGGVTRGCYARSSPYVPASQPSTSGWCPSPGHTPPPGLAGRGLPSRSHGRSSSSP